MNHDPVVDVHQHLGPWPFFGRWGGIEENLRLMARRGIDAAIISSARAIVQDMVAGNAELAVCIDGHPQLFGYITVNPTLPTQSADELQRYAQHPQFVGVKIHTHYSGCSMGDPRLEAFMNQLEIWGKPLLIHTWGAGEVAHLRRLAMRYPRLPIIMAHAGGDAWREGIAAAADCPNLILDFASSTPHREAIARALCSVGAERIVFGTDATLFDPLYMRAVFEALLMDPSQAINAADRALIMGGNALRLFGIAASPTNSR